ncbi:MAG: putative cell division FtsK/SpoIIIE [Candidatus Berkelbacteria bacterium Licking1014_7]|uniref:Putative cell division FtsK/SpoIIIE n=1 Tax=Candidatus Berkelbacteria bacterium Licking1014_7 TaxID=2017147 RepID=A0A554LKU1_9BACT|nr:MAG: putative cell division FtsK/SpoIIIE [Candidatus Berkelbacteria bacterium Licking1014_7]
MGRKRKYRKHSEDSWYKKFDWTLDPQTKREILSVIFLALGVIFLLSIFGTAGTFGLNAFNLISDLFGLGAFVVPFAFLIIGYFLWKTKELNIKPTSIIGILGLFIFVPSLFADKGGSVGATIFDQMKNSFGLIAGVLLTFALNMIFLLLATNTSIRQIRQWAGQDDDNTAQPENKVSVFETVINKFTKKAAEQSTQTLTENNPQQSFTPRTQDKDWKFPPLELLFSHSTRATSGNISRNAEIIQKTLKDFNIQVNMGDVNIGPTVTQYTLKPHEGVKLTQIVARSNDLSLALAAHPIRIEAPIPGKSAVGIEIPNKIPATVTLKEILESEVFIKQKNNLSIALGRDVAGAPFTSNLAKMPHLLIAGATGSGKSNFINALILTLLFQNSPTDLRIILIDPKRVEFIQYNGIPNLLTPVVIEVKKTINTLKWAVSEMEKRFKLFAQTRKRNIEEYNQDPIQGHMPYIIVIIDELADLMAQAANEVEAAIVRLSQMARATGIHLVVATQRPSVNVITGLIKANIPTRIAFAVASQIDSRTILDSSGAEKLLGNGDMLYQSAELSKPRRAQSPLIQVKEIKAVCDYLKKEGEAIYDDSIQNYRPISNIWGVGEDGELDDDLYEEAKETVIQHGRASASLLQRRLRIGYARAARLLDILEQHGIIGTQQGSKPREILSNNDSDRPQNNISQPPH